MTTFTLSKPLKTHQGETSTLELKEPTVGDFVMHGEPFKIRAIGEHVEIEYHNGPMVAFIASMSGIDSIILRGISASDYLKLRDRAVQIILSIAGDDGPFVSSGGASAS
jgi:hypothetical protein